MKEAKLHTEACRKRFEEAMDGDEMGREIKRKKLARENGDMADDIEQDEREKEKDQEADEGRR